MTSASQKPVTCDTLRGLACERSIQRQSLLPPQSWSQRGGAQNCVRMPLLAIMAQVTIQNLKRSVRVPSRHGDSGLNGGFQSYLVCPWIFFMRCASLNSVTDDSAEDNTFGVYRYSLSSTRWIYCGCRGPAMSFVTLSRASPRGGFG